MSSLNSPRSQEGTKGLASALRDAANATKGAVGTITKGAAATALSILAATGCMDTGGDAYGPQGSNGTGHAVSAPQPNPQLGDDGLLGSNCPSELPKRLIVSSSKPFSGKFGFSNNIAALGQGGMEGFNSGAFDPSTNGYNGLRDFPPSQLAEGAESGMKFGVACTDQQPGAEVRSFTISATKMPGTTDRVSEIVLAFSSPVNAVTTMQQISLALSQGKFGHINQAAQALAAAFPGVTLSVSANHTLAHDYESFPSGGTECVVVGIPDGRCTEGIKY